MGKDYDVIAADAIARREQRLHVLDDGATLALETVFDIEPVIEQNKVDMREAPGNFRGSEQGLGVRVASIPMPIFMELQRRGLTKDPRDFKKWLDDPDNRLWRTAPGRLA